MLKAQSLSWCTAGACITQTIYAEKFSHSASALQVPVMRDALLKQGNWQQVADKQRKAFFSPAASAQQSKRQMDDMLKALDFMCNLQPDKPQAPVSLLLPCLLDACCNSLCYHACWMLAVTASGAFMCNLQLDKPQAPVSRLLLYMLDACYDTLWCLHMQAALGETTSC